MKQTIGWLLGLFAISCSIHAIEAVDTGIYVSSNHFSSAIFWLDNDNLLVAGVLVEKKSPEPTGRRLLRYRIADRNLTDMGQIGGGLCVSDGYVRFWRPTPETAAKPLSQQKKLSFAGPLDNLVEVPPPPPVPPNFLPRDPLHGCQYPHELAAPPWLEEARTSGRVFKPLKPEHGWVEMVVHSRDGIRSNPDYPAAIFKPDGSSVRVDDVFRPYLREGFSLWSPEYVPVKDAYLVVLTYYDSLSRPPGSPLAWWMYPNGKVEELVFANPAYQFWGNRVFTRVGHLIIRPSFGKRTLDEAGIYRDDVNGPVKLVPGRIMDKTSVSPNGCLVAFGNDDRSNAVPGNETYKLQVIDVCERKPK